MTTLGQVQVASPAAIEEIGKQTQPRTVKVDRREGSETGSQPILMVDTALLHRARPRISADSGRASTSLESLDGESMLPPQAYPRRGSRRRSQDVHDRQSSSAARYVTVSSILSRSGATVALSTYAEAMLLQDEQSSNYAVHEQQQQDQQHPYQKASLGSKRASNGSALEALGALFLQQDSSGKVSSLSFMRHSGTRSRDERPRKERKVLSSLSRGLSGGATRLGIRMPNQDDAGETIAQRRARKIGNGGDGGLIQSTKRNEPRFEVMIANPSYPTILPPPAPRLEGKNNATSSPPPLASDFDISDDEGHSLNRTLRAPLTAPSAVYGPESAFSWIEPPELPPSPIAMPGAWLMGQNRWNSDRFEEGALLLPPPLLDDQGSDAKSFEGLLGIRRMREQERARKQLDKLKARNRPAHRIGMMTAFSNFVKAAHAADRATRASSTRSRIPLPRRHTEPVGDHSSANVALKGNSSPEESGPLQTDLTSANATATSTEGVGRQLDTVYETSTISASNTHFAVPEEDRDEDAISDIDVLEGCDEYRDATKEVTGHTRLPMRVASKEDVRASLLSSSRSSLDGDRRSMRGSTFGVEPLTPRIGPTMLSLPPSPWTPYGAHSRSGSQTPYFVQLGMTPVTGALPGTPRLMPALLEVLSAPSPFPFNAGMTPLIRSPRSTLASSRQMPTSSVAATEGLSSNISAAPSPLVLSPSESPMLLSTSPRPPSIRRRKTVAATTERDEQRLTPMASMSSAQEYTARNKLQRRSSGHKVPNPASQADATRKRSFLLWFLFGDLGLGTSAKIAAKADGLDVSSTSSYPSLFFTFISVSAHVYGFTVFLLAHMVDLAYRIAEFLATAFWFVRWMTLNVTGQTVLARCVIDAYNLVAREWETVSKEDHEGKADELEMKREGKAERRGLTKWQVMKGLLELYCLQDVTREQYLKEGAGLQEFTGWKRRKSTLDDGVGKGIQLDLGAVRAADRKAKAEQDDRDDDSHDEEDDDESDADDEMVVTRRGPDILEFTKTPRVEPRQYFSSFSEGGNDDETDGGGTGVKRTQNVGRRSSSFASGAGAVPRDGSDARQTVRTIKWASRLAISAYGLHVTLVDLPATFTPSGDRFSRQTFAHLSRLHHEDVLHADIQTLDSADYSPTFYLVRDLSRRCVAVSVRGTQSLQDIIVDLDLMVDQVKLPNKDIEDENDDDEPLYCHAGILRAAQALIGQDSTLFRTLRDALNEHPDFSVVFTGHSLGGAIASAVVLLLSRYETSNAAAATPGDQAGAGRWLTHDRSGLPAGRPIRAIAFAHPATFNAKLAARAATGITPLVLSVVLGHDIIPRCGHGQARELRRVLGALSRVRRRKEAGGGRSRRNSIVDNVVVSRHADKVARKEQQRKRDDDEEEDDARVHIFTSWRAWRAIKAKGNAASAKEEEQASRIEQQLWHLRCDVEGDLYSAVKRRSQESRSKTEQHQGEGADDTKPAQHLAAAARSNIPPSPWIGPWQQASVPLHQLAARRQALDAVTLANEESVSQAAGVLVPAGRSIWLYEGKLYTITSPLSFFSLPDFHPRMFSEHFPSAYEDWLERL